ncbi:RNA polymerase sigma factor [Streptomyces sp. NPDC088400]|uniref:RNA polymerase sigma factor n=1 Tax=Streptomyces sp. NPDC088400 TaxID=3365861 RepID=UPI0037F16552
MCSRGGKGAGWPVYRRRVKSRSPDTFPRTTGAHRALRRAPRPAAQRPPARYEPYLDGLFTYCLSVLCDHDAATEVLGEVLSISERQYGRCPSGAGERKAWLYALARWACLRRLTEQRRHRQGAHSGHREPEPAPAAAVAPETAERRRRELSLLAWPEAAGTTPEQREILELAVRHQLGPRDAAAVLSMEPATARELLASAACEVERTRAALAVVDTGDCPSVARLTGDSQVLLSAALRRELVRHVDDCPRCRRAAERAEAAGPWPGSRTSPASSDSFSSSFGAPNASDAPHARKVREVREVRETREAREVRETREAPHTPKAPSTSSPPEASGTSQTSGAPGTSGILGTPGASNAESRAPGAPPGAPAAPAAPGGAPGAVAVLPLVEAPRTAAYTAMTRVPRARTTAPRFGRNGFPLDPKDRAARRDRLRARAVTTTVVATVVAAPVIALWTAYRGAPQTGEGHEGSSVSAGETDGPPGLDGQPYGADERDKYDEYRHRYRYRHGYDEYYENAGSARNSVGSGFIQGGRAPDVSVEVISDGTAVPLAGPQASGHLTVEARPAGDTTLITLGGSGGAPVSWTAGTMAPWLKLSRHYGTLAPGESITIRAVVDHRREPSGPWSARIALYPAGSVVKILGYGSRPPSSDRPGRPGHHPGHPGHSGHHPGHPGHPGHHADDPGHQSEHPGAGGPTRPGPSAPGSASGTARPSAPSQSARPGSSAPGPGPDSGAPSQSAPGPSAPGSATASPSVPPSPSN